MTIKCYNNNCNQYSEKYESNCKTFTVGSQFIKACSNSKYKSKFKLGDKVKIPTSTKIYEIIHIYFSPLLNIYTYELKNDKHIPGYIKESDITLYEEKKDTENKKCIRCYNKDCKNYSEKYKFNCKIFTINLGYYFIEVCPNAKSKYKEENYTEYKKRCYNKKCKYFGEDYLFNCEKNKIKYEYVEECNKFIGENKIKENNIESSTCYNKNCKNFTETQFSNCDGETLSDMRNYVSSHCLNFIGENNMIDFKEVVLKKENNNIKINYQMLVDNNACNESLIWFDITYGKNIDIDINNLKKSLEFNIKDKEIQKNWLKWLDTEYPQKNYDNTICVDEIQENYDYIYIVSNKDLSFKSIILNFNNSYVNLNLNFLNEIIMGGSNLLRFQGIIGSKTLKEKIIHFLNYKNGYIVYQFKNLEDAYKAKDLKLI